mgnify:CR=1 FL=1
MRLSDAVAAVARYIRLISRDKINRSSTRVNFPVSAAVVLFPRRVRPNRSLVGGEREREREETGGQLPDERNLLRKGGIINRSNLKGDDGRWRVACPKLYDATRYSIRAFDPGKF